MKVNRLQTKPQEIKNFYFARNKKNVYFKNIQEIRNKK